jgi:hypothetical protein
MPAASNVRWRRHRVVRCPCYVVRPGSVRGSPGRSERRPGVSARRYGGRADCAAVADVALVVDSGEAVLPNYTGEPPVGFGEHAALPGAYGSGTRLCLLFV